MKWIYDLVLLLVFAYIIIRGWRQGILASVLRLAGWGIAVFIILKFVGTWAENFYFAYIENSAITAVQAALPPDVVTAMQNGADVLSTIQSVMDSLGGVLGSLLGNVNLDSSSMAALQDVMSLDEYSLSTVIVQSVLQPVLIAAVKDVISAVVLLVSVLLFNFLSRQSVKLNKNHNILTRGNQIIGVVAAALQCLAVGFVSAYILQQLAPIINAPWLNADLLQSTMIFRVFML